MQTLVTIQLSNITVLDSLIIKVSDRLKTSRIGRSQALLLFKPFLKKPKLCVFSLTIFYFKITYDLRQETCNSLFIFSRSPYNAAFPQTLGRWVKAGLYAAGVDISIFSAHSTRHASTSLAAAKDISVDEIRRTAGWSSSSNVFARFYNRPIVNQSSFQSTILQN